jgi:hypothetical protein
MWRRVFSRENAYALAVCLLAILLIIVTTEGAPRFIYQGF